MPSIRQLPSGLWNVQIRVKGQKPRSASFQTKEEAQKWSVGQLTEIKCLLPMRTLYELGERFISIGLRGKRTRNETYGQLNRLCREFKELGLPQNLDQITSQHINTYRLFRLQRVANATCRKDLSLLSRIYKWGRREYMMNLSNPVDDVTIPPPSKPRTRIVEPHEVSMLMASLSPVMATIVELAYETAMRRSEIIKLTPSDLHLEERFLNVIDGKTGDRPVPLSVVDALNERGYVEHHMGFYERDDIGGSRLSRMRTTDKLINLIKDKHAIPPEAIQQYKGTECIILRDKDEHGRKIDAEYTDTLTTTRMRRELTAYNELLLNTDIALLNAPPEGVPSKNDKRLIKIDDRSKFVRRIFSNGSWNEGGRFYGGWWQRIPWDWRVQISLNGSEYGSVEIDYSGLHIVLLYALEGIDYWQRFGADYDPYVIDNYEPSERMRFLLKQVLLITINAKNRRKALSALQKEINFDPENYGWIKKENFSLHELIDAFVMKHSHIEKYFFSNYGVKLQRLDSWIAEQVIKYFTDFSIPILCIHDSFVIHPDHADKLTPVMNQAIWEATKKLTAVTLDITPVLKTKTYWDVIQ